MLNVNSQQQPLNSNENRSMLHRNREPYKNVRRGFNTRTRTLTTPLSTMTHANMAHWFHNVSYITPETLNTCHVNGHFTNHTYKATQPRRHAQHTTPFRMTNTSHEQEGFYQRGLPR